MRCCFNAVSLRRIFCLVLLLSFVLAPLASASDAPPSGDESHHVSRGERIAVLLRRGGLPDEWIVMLISALPIVELRGSIPVGLVVLKMAPAMVFWLAIVGNMLPIPFILLLLGPVSRFCMRYTIGRRFFEWLFARTRKKTGDIEKYETMGLTVFVAIPLPVTGAWTGAMAAFLLGLSFRHAMVSILLGVIIAGVIMTILSLLGWLGALIAGVALLTVVVSGMSRWLKKEDGQEVSGEAQDNPGTASFETTRDILEHVKAFHGRLSGIYEQMEQNVSGQKMKILLNYMSRHEEHMVECLAEYEADAAKRILDTWFKYTPELPQYEGVANATVDAEMTIDQIVAVALRFDHCLVSFYEEIAAKAVSREVKDLFIKLLEMEKKEETECLRNALAYDEQD